MPSATAVPKLNKGPSQKTAVSRCRLRLICDGDTDGLALRPILVGGATCPTLCCESCADAAAQAGGQQ